MGAVLYFVLGLLTTIKDGLKAAGAWLTANPARMAFTVLIALCAFFAWRLSSVDGDRDEWRDKAGEYEAASKAIAKADKLATQDAAERRKADADAITKAEKERTDEIAKAAPGRTSDAAVRLGCVRLRQAGQDTSGIAACR